MLVVCHPGAFPVKGSFSASPSWEVSRHPIFLESQDTVALPAAPKGLLTERSLAVFLGVKPIPPGPSGSPITSVASELGFSFTDPIQGLFGSLLSQCSEAGLPLFPPNVPKGNDIHQEFGQTFFWKKKQCENCPDPCSLKHLRSKLQEVVDSGHKGHHLPALLSHFSAGLTGQLPVITEHTRKWFAAKQSERGISGAAHATQMELLHLVGMQLHSSSS